MYNYHIQYVCITLQCQLYLHMKINITYVNIYIHIYIFDLHGPRHIQKTRPKLIAIEPKLIAIPLWGFHNWGYPPNHPLSKWIFLNHPAIGLSRTPIATPPVIIVSGSLPRKHLFEQLEACGGGLRSFPDTVRK